MFSLPRTTLLSLLLCGAGCVAASEADHREFGATLAAPYHGEPAPGEPRTFSLAFDYPLVAAPQTVGWTLELTAPDGRVARQWSGQQELFRAPVNLGVRWDGRLGSAAAPAGIYRVRLVAEARAAGGGTIAGERVEQSWEIAVGRAAPPAMPAFRPLARRTEALAMAPAPGDLPYDVYLGNLHSQTAHSDGGGDLATCTGAQDPQSSTHGPSEAFAYARDHGLDVLVASEHNHMYDGSAGTNPAATPAAAKALYRSGLDAAKEFNAAHSDFLAVYGLEWGVIANGGHLNIFNSNRLLGWERNAAGKLLAESFTPKSDYASLYTLMRQRGLVGQFNHPSQSGQFLVGGVPFGYTPDGDAAMALCEVVNSNAFSTSTTESETRRSNFELACDKALEAGYHVAFSSNQDNHCANWGMSYTNRTGVLLPAGAALTTAAFLDALRARRVFATMDKGSQLVLTANGRMMGERFANIGPLSLVAHFASVGGKAVASVVMFEGVPGRKGAVAELSRTPVTTITPDPGEHFYYVRVTQDDGNMLWSAPVWVTQQ
ncbi:CehA/McbA family metallohydrolase [Massilia sp. R2A-15]|uniref:CehA/McbA family metallohydrolase n=1 Tax=Massilia sp. R2A-15 TaxID=3064278 RepID=UPI00273597AC|nr:CehA/McbA family metallohydrolase [Massilia sp. R2A-15]WLI89356.1 CehA/McbA family metallohydrolase [Massilia sp. R2A-15]